MPSSNWRVRSSKKKCCPFSSKKIPITLLDYKNPRFLRRYINEIGKIVPSRITGLKKVPQHKLSIEVEHARYLALIPYCDRH